MKKVLAPSLLALAISGQVAAGADAELLAEIAAMKARLAQLEQKVGSLQEENNTLRVAQQAPAHHSDSPRSDVVSAHHPLSETSPVAKAVETVELSGTVEVGAYAGKGYSDENTSDLTVDTAAIGLNAQLNDYSSAEISLLYEEDATDLEVDTASLTFARTDSPWSA